MQTAASITLNSRLSTSPRARCQAHIRPVTFHAPDCVIYAQGERTRSLYQIEYGAVRIYRLLADGRRQIVAFHLVGETFGFEINETHSFYAEAMVNTTVPRVKCRRQKRSAGDRAGLALEIAWADEVTRGSKVRFASPPSACVKLDAPAGEAAIIADLQPEAAQRLCADYQARKSFCVVKKPSDFAAPYSGFWR